MSRSEWFDGPTGPGDGSARPEGPDEGRGGPPRATRSAASGPAGHHARSSCWRWSSSAASSADVLTDVWWYDSVGFRDVFVKELTTKVGLFVVAGAASPARPWPRAWSSPTAPARSTSRSPRRSRCSSSTARPSSRCAASPCGRSRSCSACSPAPARWAPWRTFLLWANREPFGIKDPQFGLDVGFFVFTLPWLRFVVSFLTVVLVLAFVAAAFTHYVYGGLQLPGPRADHPRGLRAPRHPRRAHRADPRRVVLARPLLAVDPEGLAAHRHHLHRRQRRAADQGDPRGRRA